MISSFLNEQMVYAISQTVVHSLWQGLLVGLILFVALKFVHNSNSELRYKLSLSALIGLFVMSLYTFVNFLHPEGSSPIVFLSNLSDSNLVFNTEGYNSISNSCLLNYEKYIANFWLLGLMILSIRLIFGLIHLKNVSSTHNLIANSFLTNRLHHVSAKLNCPMKIVAFESSKVSSPLTFGFFKSIVLLPIGLINQLTIEEVDAILYHEVAHIIRKDFLMNLILTSIETLYYYHPVVWWISHVAKIEREHSCDQAALRNGVSKLDYAKLLVKLQDLNLRGTTSLAMHFSDNSNDFKNRINKILNMNNRQTKIKSKLFTVLAICGIFAFFSFKSLDEREIIELPTLERISSFVNLPESIEIPKLEATVTDTLPQTENAEVNISIRKDDMKVEIIDGDIEFLEIDGKEIPKEEYDKYKNKLKGENWDIHLNTDQFHFDWNDNNEIFKFKKLSREDFPMDSSFASVFSFPDVENFEREVKIFKDGKKMDLEEFRKLHTESFKDVEKKLKKLKQFPDGKIKWIEIDKDKWIMDDFINEDQITEQIENALKEIEGLNLEELHKFEFDHPLNFEKAPFDNFKSLSTPFGRLSREMQKDGILEPNKLNRVQLTRKHLKINGDKQPSNLHNKYLRLYESLTGFALNGKTKLEFELQANGTNYLRSI